MPPPTVEMKTVLVDKRSEHGGEYIADEHFLSLADLAARYDTRLDAQAPASSLGLSPEEAAARLAQHGPNVLLKRKTIPEWKRLLICFQDPLLIQLVVAGVLAFVAYAIDTTARTAKVNLYLGGALLAIVLATGFMTYAQERHTQAILAQIAGLLASRCLVVRDGFERRIDATQLVPGDVVCLALGDRVPADLRVIVSEDLRTDKSGITGESAPVRASAESDAPGTLALHARSLVFNSSLVVAGAGYGVVTRTGNQTMIGSIASLAGGTSGVGQTLLRREVKRFVKFIATLAVVSAVPLFIIGMARAAAIHHGHVPRAAYTNVIVNALILTIVANTPQGLPATLSSCLAISARRMAQRHVIVKKLDIIESLGSCTVIATDKTGTLTENRMSVEHLWYSRSVYHAASTMTLHQREHTAGTLPEREPTEQYEVAPKVQRVLSFAALEDIALEEDEAAACAEESIYTLSGFTISGPAVAQKMSQSVPPWRAFTPHAKLLAISALCNRARPAAADAGPAPPTTGAAEHAVTGNAADAALFRYAELFFAVSSARAQFPRVFDVPFSSTTKFAATVVMDRAGPSDRQIVMFKGAPEVILQKCSTWLHGKTEHAIDDAFREEFQHVYERFGALGERVLGFAFATVPAARADAYLREPERIPTSGATFVGLISLVDPPRAGVAEAINTCRAAGIRVTMVTGDSPITAEAIARKVGIITLPTRHDLAGALHLPDADVAAGDVRIGAVVVTGEQLNALTSDSDWDALLSKPELVIARSSPQQKLKLVENYQRRGEIVAVTGDGVNDAPALKRAHIGVAMGSPAASDVARESADIVLMDDNFASIVNAIEEARRTHPPSIRRLQVLSFCTQGRTLFDNLKKTIAYTLAHIVGELVPVILQLAFGFPLPLQGLTILTIDLLTEQGPAISLAFEHAEHAVMLRKPRNLQTETLVSKSSIFYSYVLAGFAEAAVCFFAYALVYTTRGIALSELAFSTDKNPFFDVPASPPMQLSAAQLATNRTYSTLLAPAMHLPAAWVQANEGASFVPPLWVASGGRVYDARAQWRIYRESQSAWYLTLILCQFWHIWNARTRAESIFKHGLFANVVSIYGAGASVAIACMLVYIPVFHRPTAFETGSLKPLFWTPHFAFCLYIFTLNEGLKWMVRHRPDSFVARRFAW